MKKEFCIMKEFKPYFTNKRFNGSERHEIFEGRNGNRDKSIEDGLVIFTTPQMHRTHRNSIHLNPEGWIWLKELGEKTWCEYYGKTKEDFRERYGKNYL